MHVCYSFVCIELSRGSHDVTSGAMGAAQAAVKSKPPNLTESNH